jgi:hypothetical protein
MTVAGMPSAEKGTLPVRLLVGEVLGMTEPGNELAAGTGGHGHLHASQADREQVIDVLKTAFVQGRLDREELGLRIGWALASRTYADLATLIADIPARLPRARPPRPAREPVSKKAVVAMACATTTLIGLWPVMMLTPPWPRFVLPVAMLWFILVIAVPAGWLALLHDWLDKSGALRSPLGRRLRPASGLGGPHAR